MTGFYRDLRQMIINDMTGWRDISRFAGYFVSWVGNCDPQLHILIPSNTQ
jgi:hypothetical protein